MGRIAGLKGTVALVLAIGVTLAIPLQSASAERLQPIGTGFAHRVPATSWGLISVARSSTGDELAVGYSEEPSTEPVALYWNGTAWTVTPTPAPRDGAILYTDTAVPKTNDFFAGGESCTSKACPGAYMLEWNGTSWSQMTLPKLLNATDIDGVSASSADNAWAVGQSCNYVTYACNVLILHWNGTSWSQVKIPKLAHTYPDLYTVADVSTTDTWAGGSSFSGALALNWNGRSWHEVPIPAGAGYTEAITSIAHIPGTSEIWALMAASGGYFAMKWNGTSWRGFALPRKPVLKDVSAVASSSVTNAWVVGNSYSRSGTEPSFTAHWNGRDWTTVPAPSPGPDNELFSVTSPSDESATAVGVTFSPFEPNLAKGLVYQWNGTAWSRQKVPTPVVPSAGTREARKLTEARKF